MKRAGICWAALFAFLLCASGAFGATTYSEQVEFRNGFKTDDILERTSGSGVTIDSLQIKDGEAISSTNAGSAPESTITVVEYSTGVVHQSVFTFAYTMTITDTGANGAHGSVQFYDFPAGQIKIVGSTADVTGTCGTDGLTATATNEIGVGTATAGTDNATLTSTEEDILTGNASDLVASVESYHAVNGTSATHDGTATAKDAFLNFVFAADDASDNDACVMTGTVTITWINLGDY